MVCSAFRISYYRKAQNNASLIRSYCKEGQELTLGTFILISLSVVTMDEK